MQVDFLVAFTFTSAQLAVKDEVVQALPDTVGLIGPVHAHLRVFARPDALRANGSTDLSVPGRAELTAVWIERLLLCIIANLTFKENI